MLSFLETLFCDIGSQWFTLWRLADKSSTSFSDPEKAAEWIGGLPDLNDIYVAAGLCEKPVLSNTRCKASEVSGIVGLWADIDIYDPNAHSKPNLPPTISEAVKLAYAAVKPSLIVHSGHGLQVWWLFKEPWMFDNDAEHQRAAQLSQKWQSLLRAEAGNQGWDVDATHDLARVLRLPGTINAKVADKPVEVTILQECDARYNPSYLEDLCAEIVVPPEPKKNNAALQAKTADFTISENAWPPDRVEALRSNDKKFDLSLKRERRDFQDQSASTYDMSIASTMAASGFTNQEIVDTLQWCHRIHRDAPRKHNWQDYYRRTLDKIREGKYDGTQTMSQRESLSPANAAEREVILDELAHILGVRITHVIRYSAANAEYAIQTETQTLMLGDVGGLMDMNRFRKAFADATCALIPRMKPAQWDAVVQRMLQIREEESIGPQATREGYMSEVLEEYLIKEFEPVEPDKIAEAAQNKRGFVKDGVICLFGITLRTWMKQQFGENMTAKEFGICMRAVGAESTRIFIDKQTYAIWTLPATFNTLL